MFLSLAFGLQKLTDEKTLNFLGEKIKFSY